MPNPPNSQDPLATAGERFGGDSRRSRLEFLRTARHGEEGLGLLEVMIAFTVLLTLIIPISLLEGTLSQQAANSNQRVAADQVAESWLEQLGVQNPLGTQFPITAGPFDTTVGGELYKAWYTLSLTSNNGVSLCTSGVPQLVDASVTVKWGINDQNVIEESTHFNPSSQILGPNNGFLAIPIRLNTAADPSGNTWPDRAQAIPITITGGSPTTTIVANPDPSGCVFVEVPSGTYTISLGAPNSNNASFVAAPTVPFVEPPNIAPPITLSTSYTVTPLQTTLVPAIFFDEGSEVSLDSPSLTLVDQGVVCTQSDSTCLALGEGPTSTGTGEGYLSSGSLTTWSGTNAVPQVARFDVASCGASTCLAVGVAPGGGLEYSTGGSATPITTLGSVSSIQQLSCTGSLYCAGLGTNGSSLVTVTFDGTNWSTVATTGWPSNLTSLTQVSDLTCPASGSCYAIGTPPSPTAPEFLSLSGTTWSSIALPSGDTSASQLTCPGTTSTSPCFALGSANDMITLSSATATSSNTGITGVSLLSCSSTTSCSVIGGASSNTYSSGAWSATPASLPSGVETATDLECPAGSSVCYAMGNTSASAAGEVPVPIVLSGESWTPTSTIPANTWLSGLTCPTASVCYATAVLSSGKPRVFVLQGGTSGTWSKVTLSSSQGWADGVPCSDNPYANCQSPLLPIQIETGATPTVFPNSALPSSTPWETLYPTSGGYSLWASTCTAPSDAAAINATPGGTTTVAPAMGLLAVQATGAAGPISGATVTATLTSCSSDGGLAVTLPPTGSDGLTSLAVPPGTYSISVTSGSATNSNAGSETVAQQASWNPVEVTP